MPKCSVTNAKVSVSFFQNKIDGFISHQEYNYCTKMMYNPNSQPYTVYMAVDCFFYDPKIAKFKGTMLHDEAQDSGVFLIEPNCNGDTSRSTRTIHLHEGLERSSLRIYHMPSNYNPITLKCGFDPFKQNHYLWTEYAYAFIVLRFRV